MTSNNDKMGLRYEPMAFTEQGVAMLSSVLKSERAIEVNIAIMRAFVRLRQMLSSKRRKGRQLDLEVTNCDRLPRAITFNLKVKRDYGNRKINCSG